jgi:lipopolysaccharide/colanic/teichoic acid biosynthesis glycosyltransferase
MLRRGLDITLAAVAAIAAAPVALAVGGAVGLTIGRPILFVQQRSGLRGVPFAMIKFRTMHDSRDAAGRPLADAARVTRLGSFLRRTRLDELPGLWHVVRGEMALIGPRPLLPSTIQAMGPGGVARGRVRPGLTGWAQTNGNSLLDEGDKLALDLWYIEHASLLLDLRILVRTVTVILRGERVDRRQLGRAHASGLDRRG